MAVQTIIPSSNVTMADIRDTLNNAGGVVDNNLVSFFAAAAKINKWAKYKPTIYYDQPFLDDERRWQGGNGLCGFTDGSIVFSTVEALISAYKSEATFIYDIPSGGIAEPMRLGDFRGYMASAQAPIWDFYIHGSFTSSNTGSQTIDCELVSNDPDPEYELLMSYFSPTGANVAEWFFGVIIVTDKGTIAKKSSTTKLGSASDPSREARVFSVSKSEMGSFSSFNAYPCLYERVPQSNTSHGRVMALPCAAAGGSFPTNGVKGEIQQELAAVGWVGNGYVYTFGFVTFRGVLGYDASDEGKKATITLRINNNGTVRLSTSYEITLSKTEVSATGSYRMDFEYQSKWYTQSGDTYEMIVFYNIPSSPLEIVVKNEAAPPL